MEEADESQGMRLVKQEQKGKSLFLSEANSRDTDTLVQKSLFFRPTQTAHQRNTITNVPLWKTQTHQRNKLKKIRSPFICNCQISRSKSNLTAMGEAPEPIRLTEIPLLPLKVLKCRKQRAIQASQKCAVIFGRGCRWFCRTKPESQISAQATSPKKSRSPFKPPTTRTDLQHHISPTNNHTFYDRAAAISCR